MIIYSLAGYALALQNNFFPSNSKNSITHREEWNSIHVIQKSVILK